MYLMAAPLPAGPHTIHFSGAIPNFIEDITYNLTVVPTPALTMARQGNNVVVSWPQAASWYAVETTTSLNSPNWVTSGAPIQQAGGFNQVTIPIGSGSQFFRLKRN